VAQADGIRRRKKAAGEPVDPVIPDKLYFRIGEVARLLALPPYVLRFWESEFTQLHPNKGGTGQRLYRRRDVEMAMRIKQLLYYEGYTIPGARQLLKSESRQREPELPFRAAGGEGETNAALLMKMRSDLKEIATLLERPLPGSRRVPQPKPDRKGLHLAQKKRPEEVVHFSLFRKREEPTEG